MIRLNPIKRKDKKEYANNQFEQEQIIYNDLPQSYKFKYSGSKRITRIPRPAQKLPRRTPRGPLPSAAAEPSLPEIMLK